MRHWVPILLLPLIPASAAPPFKVEVVDRENGWPVPLVELRTTQGSIFVTDNAGIAALDAPELFGDGEVWIGIEGDGYEVPADGFGFRGVRAKPVAGGSLRVEVARKVVAKRLGRLTGAGLFAENVKTGGKSLLPETGVNGCDTVFVTRYGTRLFWLWGDTNLPSYPLGIFDTSAATTTLNPLATWQPPLAIDYQHFRDAAGKPRGVAAFPGDGPTWLGGLVSLKDAAGAEHLVATYSKIRPPLDEYEIGLCEWDAGKSAFQPVRVLWKEGDGKKPLSPKGHFVAWKDPSGKEWQLCGDPFPELRFPSAYESWKDPTRWEPVPHPASPRAADGSTVDPHRGMIAYSPFLRKWVVVYTQNFGKPSAFGEIWFSTADSPLGPWGKAVKVLSHRNYTFYNPVVHTGLAPENASFLLFEGTYTTTFADRAVAIPRYDYNQILYRLDLDDPRLR